MTRLDAVRAAATASDAARHNLHQKMRLAAKKHSLREIATAAGMSHEQVRRLLR